MMMSIPRRMLLVGSLAYATVLPSAQGDEIETVVVTGTRAPGHTQENSATPIVVYDARRLEESGYPDLGRALAAIAPSVNMSHSQTSPSAANTRSITLKGLAPDQVLVLVNGKRWQPSSVLVFNNAVGRGSAPYDLGAIPLNAVARIEVLDDGAAAQYGSDAIAGVVNIILRSNDSDALYSAQAGVTEKGDGFSYDIGGSQGLRLAEKGHLTLSADLRHQDITNRATADPRNGNRIDQQAGDPRALDIGIAADLGYSLSDAAEIYGSFIASRRDSESAPTFRLRGSSPLYPNGFLPQVEPVIWSVTDIAGVRSDLAAGFNADLSNSFGYNSAHFSVHNSANDALGTASPTAFYAGTLEYWQDTVNVTLRRDFGHSVLPGSLAFGGEYRKEHYGITPGDPVSYQSGGAQGFPGFAPRIPVDNSRNAASAFIDVEIKPLKWVTVSGAGRFDHYSDFGDAATWKGTVRAEATQWLAFRGSWGTAFRAPSLQQQFFSSVVSQISPTGALLRTGTYQVGDPVATALGATPLKPERSQDYTVGGVVHADNLLLSADWYDINIRDRVVLSDQLKGAAVTSILAANGITDVQQAQFFTNAAHTRTRGYEVVAAYTWNFTRGDLLRANLQYGQYHTSLISLAANPVLPTLPLLGVTSKGLLLSAQPRDKLTSSLTFTHARLSASINVDRYGPWLSTPLGVTQNFGAKTVADLVGSVDLSSHMQLGAGILNMGDTYPDRVAGGNALGLAYGDEAPFGINGRSYFVRLQFAY